MTEGAGRMGEIPAAEPIDAADGLAAASEVVDGQRGRRTSTQQPVRAPRRRRSPLAPVRSLGSGIAAVGVKELRGRMRGRRAFVILTDLPAVPRRVRLGVAAHRGAAYGGDVLSGGSAAFASALIGQEIFGALLVVETLLVVFLAPAMTAGAISLEREKQTLDMLATTPISSLAIVVGKLLSALTYVFILIIASIPLTAIVFVFGGVGPDEVLRGYLVLFVTAIGLGSLGLFISALMQRTQAATVVTFFGVLGADARHAVRRPVLDDDGRARAEPDPASDRRASARSRAGRRRRSSWFNPFAAQYDVICGASDGYGGWCSRLADLTNGAISIGIGGGAAGGSIPTTDAGFGCGRRRGRARGKAIADVAPVQPFGIRRDTFWPRSVVAWLALSAVLILASVQLVSPTRRWRLPFSSAGPEAA